MNTSDSIPIAAYSLTYRVYTIYSVQLFSENLTNVVITVLQANVTTHLIVMSEKFPWEMERGKAQNRDVLQ